jgi:hypothetical protein
MSPLTETHATRTERLMALLAEHHGDTTHSHGIWDRSIRATAADREVSRCGRCHDWRWRASYLPCQGCGASPVAPMLEEAS